MSKPERKKLEGIVTSIYTNDAATVMKIIVNGETLTLFGEKIEMYERIQEGDYLIIKECNYGPNVFKGKTTYQYTLADWDTIEIKKELDGSNWTNPTDQQLEQDEIRASEGTVNYTDLSNGPKTADIIGTYDEIMNKVKPLTMTVGINLVSKNYQKVTLSLEVDVSQVTSENLETIYDAIHYNLYQQVRKKIETVDRDMR